MAKRVRASTGTKKSGRKDHTSDIIAAALSLTASEGWRHLKLSDVAAEADIPLNDLLIPFPTKYHIINAFQDRIDARMLEAIGGAPGNDAADESDDARDRLFDLLMERFELLIPYKAALAEISKDSLCDPAALCFLPRMARSMSRILEAAGIRATHLFGIIQIKALGLIYADTFRIWLKDDSPDMAKTMAALDKDLRRAEKAMRLVSQARKKCNAGRRRSDDDGPEADLGDQLQGSAPA